MVFSSIFVLMVLSLAGGQADQSHSISAGRTLSSEHDSLLFVLVHGSDWHPFGERLFGEVWQGKIFGEKMKGVLADVDILQAREGAARAAADARNEGWVKKGSGLQTYPAVLAYSAEGVLIGSCQGRDLPKDLAAAQEVLITFGETCAQWKELTQAISQAKAADDKAAELKGIVARTALGLERSATLLEDIKRLDPSDEAGNYARLSFPKWTTLVKQATDQAKAGKGDEAEQRLKAMLANSAYTLEQLCVIHLALGSAYRRWEGHAEQAAVHFRAAGKVDPTSICGVAGTRLYLSLYGGPSLSLGWSKRHPVKAGTYWVIEDAPQDLEPGRYRLRLKRTKGKQLTITGAQLLSDGKVLIDLVQAATLTKASPTVEFIFTVPEALTHTSLRVLLNGGDTGTGTMSWIK